MASSLKAGLAYFGLVFGIGFVLGTIRALILAPKFGELVAVLIELPIILAAAWSICRWLVRAFEIPPLKKPRLVMGCVALALLMLAELALSTLFFGNSIGEYLNSYRSLHGALGLTGQVVFGAFPVIQITVD